MPKTLLAVDDSATMRKVLEITFAGEDFRVVTADAASNAMTRLSDEPSAVVIDAALEGDAYGLAKEIRSRSPRTAIVLMASRYAPYDGGRGKDAGVDDFIDKPFDTQALIDKVKKAVVARDAMKAPAPAPVPAPAPAQAPVPIAAAPPAPVVASPFAASPRPPIAGPSAARPTYPTQRTHTLSFEGSQPVAPAPAPAPPINAPAPQPAVSPISRTAPSGIPVVTGPAASPIARPAPQPISIRSTTEPAVRTPEPSPVAAAVNGQLAGKLGDLGLSQSQVDAVLALSREVVERVVWEVVPQLAETIIKEEIARLTKDA